MSTTVSDSQATYRTLILRSMAALSAVTAVIHFDVANAHYAEYWMFGVFMLVTGFLQGAWTAGLLMRPTRVVLIAGAVVNSGIVLVYVITRTVGDVVGPTPHEKEPVGFGDALCTALEFALATGALILLLRAFDKPVQRPHRVARSVPAGVSLAAAVLLAFSLVDGGSEMGAAGNMNMTPAAAPAAPTVKAKTSMSMPGMSGSEQAAAVSLKTTSPAGLISMPDPNMQMEPGMAMASAACTAKPTATQQAAAVQLVDSTWAADSKYRSLAVAKAAGFRAITPSGLPVVHYLNPASFLKVAAGGPVLNPDAPDSLVYANTPKGAVLVAVMYLETKRTATSPQPGGCLTQWHVHTNLCLSGLKVVGLQKAGTCGRGIADKTTPPMLHVWFAPIPGGPLTVDAPNQQVVTAAETVGPPSTGANGTA